MARTPRKSLYALIASFVALAAWNCVPYQGGGGDDGPRQLGDSDAATGPDGGGTESLSLESYLQSLGELRAESYCKAIFECPRKQGALTIPVGAENRPSCVEAYQSNRAWPLDRSISWHQQHLDRGWMSYDGSAAARCLEDLRNRIEERPCEQRAPLADVSEACGEVLTGERSKGQTCLMDSHCVSNRCNLETTADDACWGTCDEPFERVGAGGQCGRSTGQICEDTELECTEPNGGGTPTCTETRSIAEGASCDSSRTCEADLTCDFGSCTKITLGERGDDCSPASTNKCKPGLACRLESGASSFEDQTGTCDSAGGEGASCYSFAECAYGMYCDGGNLFGDPPSQGTCTPGKSKGSSCSEDYECQSFNCDEGTCALPERLTCEPPMDGG